MALAATDRALIRRVLAHLDSQGVLVRDESGWILSTTRSAARLMAALEAAAWNASSNAVLDWLKHTPALPPADVNRLEQWLRRNVVPQWSAAAARDFSAQPALARTVATVGWRDAPAHRTAPAAVAVGVALGAGASRPMAGPAGRPCGHARAGGAAPARRPASGTGGLGRQCWPPHDAGEFTRWVKDVLEAGRYVAAQSAEAPVVVLPMPQLLGRPFAAAVLPGSDEKRLQPAPEPRATGPKPSARPGACPHARRWRPPSAPPGPTPCAPVVDVLWRTSDEGGEPLLASALVLAQPGNCRRRSPGC